MSRLIKHYGYARYELHSEVVTDKHLIRSGCEYCGGYSKDTYGKDRLYKYYTINDDDPCQRIRYIPGLYCGIGCMRGNRGGDCE